MYISTHGLPFSSTLICAILWGSQSLYSGSNSCCIEYSVFIHGDDGSSSNNIRVSMLNLHSTTTVLLVNKSWKSIYPAASRDVLTVFMSFAYSLFTATNTPSNNFGNPGKGLATSASTTFKVSPSLVISIFTISPELCHL